MKFLHKTIISALLTSFLVSCSSNEIIVKPLPDFKESIKVQENWEESISNGNDGRFLELQPAYFDNNIYVVSYDGHIKAINNKTSNEIWNIESNFKFVSKILATEDYLFIGNDDAQIVIVDIKKGKIKKVYNLPSVLYNKPLMYDNKLILFTHDGTLSFLDIENGDFIWQYDNVIPNLVLFGNSTPIIDKENSTLFITSASGELTAFDLQNGKFLWEIPISLPKGNNKVSQMVDIIANPILDKNILYVATYQGTLAAINVDSKNILWAIPMSSYQNFSLHNGYLYLVTTNGIIKKVDAKNGNIIFSLNFLENRTLISTNIIDNTLVIPENLGYIHILNLDNGKTLNRIELGNKINSNIIKIDKKAFLIQNIKGDIFKYTL